MRDLFGKGDTNFGAQPWEWVLQEVLSLAIRSSGGSGSCKPSRLVNCEAKRRQRKCIDSPERRRGFAVRAFSSHYRGDFPRGQRNQPAAGLSILDHSWRRSERGRAAKRDGARSDCRRTLRGI